MQEVYENDVFAEKAAEQAAPFLHGGGAGDGTFSVDGDRPAGFVLVGDDVDGSSGGCGASGGKVGVDSAAVVAAAANKAAAGDVVEV